MGSEMCIRDSTKGMGGPESAAPSADEDPSARRRGVPLANALERSPGVVALQIETPVQSTYDALYDVELEVVPSAASRADEQLRI